MRSSTAISKPQTSTWKVIGSRSRNWICVSPRPILSSWRLKRLAMRPSSAKITSLRKTLLRSPTSRNTCVRSTHSSRSCKWASSKRRICAKKPRTCSWGSTTCIYKHRRWNSNLVMFKVNTIASRRYTTSRWTSWRRASTWFLTRRRSCRYRWNLCRINWQNLRRSSHSCESTQREIS